MGHPIPFKPQSVDPRKELQLRLEAAPNEHAEALLVLFDVLESAHDQGLLDMLHGAIGSRNAIVAKLAHAARQPESTQAMRNLLTLAEALGSFDAAELSRPVKQVANQVESPGLFTLLKGIFKKDVRRGLAVAIAMLSGLGRGTDPSVRK
jgi:uncharacterized protein YjgD (DUF1641 family)